MIKIDKNVTWGLGVGKVPKKCHVISGWPLYCQLKLLHLMVMTYQVKNGSVETKRTNSNRAEKNLNCSALESGEIEEGRSVVQHLVLVFVFTFDFTFLAFQMEDGSSLRMVERGRTIKCSQEKCEEDDPGYSL